MSIAQRVVLLVGAVLTSVLAVIFVVSPGVSALTALPKRPATPIGEIVFAIDAPVVGTLAWVQADEVATRSSRQPIIVKFTLEVDQFPSSGEPSVILAGRFVDGLNTCAASGLRMETVGFDSLTLLESMGLVLHEQYPSNMGELSWMTGEPVIDDETARARLGKSEYVRLTPSRDYYSPMERSVTANDAERSFSSFQTSFTCSFAPDEFWNESAGVRVFEFPDALASTSTSVENGANSYVFAESEVSFVADGGVLFRNADVDADSGSDGSLKFQSWNTGIDRPQVTVAAQGVTATFEDSAKAKKQEQVIFLAGAGVAVVGALLISTSKLFMDSLLVVPWRRLWRKFAVWMETD